MDRSPKGREIEHVEGRPGDIITRGEAITDLGDKMLDCADTLETIKNEAVGDGSQKGKAIEKLKEAIGDSYEKLREAGDLYKPVGPVITTYGNELDGCQPVINNSADDCETKWATYESLPGDREGSTTPEAGGGILGVGGYDKDSPEAKEKAENNAAKAAAYEDWLESAEAFDGGYDTWENAFDTACNNIGDAMAGSIKDSFWDNISSFVDVLVTILSWAALIIAVVAFFAGGWVLALIALGLGVLVFALTAAQYAHGEKSLTDLIFAGLAIVPVGKITHLTKLAQFPKLASALGKGRAIKRVWGALSKGPISKFMTAKGGKAFTFLKKSQITDNIFGASVQSVKKGHYKMYFTGSNYAQAQALRQAFTSNSGLRNFAIGVDVLASKFTTFSGHIGKIGTVTGNSEMKPPKWMSFI
jgi:hypothetical protein